MPPRLVPAHLSAAGDKIGIGVDKQGAIEKAAVGAYHQALMSGELDQQCSMKAILYGT